MQASRYTSNIIITLVPMPQLFALVRRHCELRRRRRRLSKLSKAGGGIEVKRCCARAINLFEFPPKQLRVARATLAAIVRRKIINQTDMIHKMKNKNTNNFLGPQICWLRRTTSTATRFVVQPAREAPAARFAMALESISSSLSRFLSRPLSRSSYSSIVVVVGLRKHNSSPNQGAAANPANSCASSERSALWVWPQTWTTKTQSVIRRTGGQKSERAAQRQ